MKSGSMRGVWGSLGMLFAGAVVAAPMPVHAPVGPPSASSGPAAVKMPAVPSAPVSWRAALSRGPVHFATDVVPILTRAGCNQGTCHGAAAGQNGFRLSLRGGDPAFDWEQIIKDGRGKRFDKAHPEKSLVFLKPTAQVSHGGGQRFPPESVEAQVLLRWLKEGAPAPD